MYPLAKTWNSNLGLGKTWIDDMITQPMAKPENLFDAGDKYYLQIAIPGIDSESVEINVKGRNVEVFAKVKPATFEEEGRFLVKGINEVDVSNSYILPTEVYGDEAVASYGSGILTLMLPKSERSKSVKVRLTDSS